MDHHKSLFTGTLRKERKKPKSEKTKERKKQRVKKPECEKLSVKKGIPKFEFRFKIQIR